MSALLAVLLFLHVISAIVAFGPSFAMPLIARLGRQNPQQGAFAVEVAETLTRRIVIPMALTMPVTGIPMIFIAGIDPLALWLVIAVIVYVAAVLFSIFIQLPKVTEMLSILRQLSAAGPPPAGSPPGPPPRVAELGASIGQGGMLLQVAIVVIVFLMVTKLTF